MELHSWQKLPLQCSECSSVYNTRNPPECTYCQMKWQVVTALESTEPSFLDLITTCCLVVQNFQISQKLGYFGRTCAREGQTLVHSDDRSVSLNWQIWCGLDNWLPQSWQRSLYRSSSYSERWSVFQLTTPNMRLPEIPQGFNCATQHSLSVFLTFFVSVQGDH